MKAEELLPDTIRTLKTMLKGYGYDRRKSQWKGSMKTRTELEKLIEQGIIKKQKNHSKDEVGFYGISITDTNQVEKLKKFLNN